MSPRAPIFVTILAAALTLPASAAAQIIVGTGPGIEATVSQYTASGVLVQSFNPYPGFTGGVRVAVGDVNGDSHVDIITGTGPAATGHVKVFSGAGGGLLHSYFPFGATFNGGVFVAAGDIDGDGRADMYTGAGEGSHIVVHSGENTALMRSFFAFSPSFTGGVRVAAGDLNGDGVPDIIAAAGPGAGPQVSVFSGATGLQLSSFSAFDPSFSGGISVAAGDINGDGRADIIVGAGPGAPGGHIRAFSGLTGELLLSFFPYDTGFTGGVNVAVGDVNGDGIADIVTAPATGAGPHVKVFNGSGVMTASFFAGDPTFTGGVYVAVIPGPGSGAVFLAAGVLATRRRRR